MSELRFTLNHFRSVWADVLFVLSIGLSTSCQHTSVKDELKDVSPYFTPFFTGSEDAVLRDVSFNISADELKKIEKAKLFEATPDHLFYEFTFQKDSTPFSEYANVQYFFNENNQLDIITADIYLSDSIQETKLKKTLNDYYNLRFGTPEKDDYEHDVWKASLKDKRTEETYNYSIALKDISGEFGVTVEYVRE